jgi:tetratricopeptide (TPR) repeat protein
MNRNIILILILLFIVILPLSAQSDAKISKKEFNNGKAGFNQAWDNVIEGDADYHRKGLFYNNAFDHYIQALAYNNSNAELNYKTGIAAIYTDRKEEAAGFFLKAFELKNKVTDDILFYTGRALQYTGRYSEAADKLTAYLKSKEKKPEINITLARRFIEECNAAIELTKDTIGIEIINLGANINSGNDDLSPVITSDGTTIYFSSQRTLGKTSVNPIAGQTDENIYFSRLVSGKWGIAAPASEDLNTSYNESPLYIDSAESRLYVYSGFENGGDIKVSENRKGNWRSPGSLPFDINTSGSETSIAFSPSGNEIYYVTNDGKDVKGGSDIYFIKRLTDKKWSKPQNAGDSINTQYDEQTVNFSLSGDTLWFSSKGHNSMGGYDLFFSVKNQDGTWKKAKNAGHPLNTPWDELFYGRSGSFSGTFYFASNRSGGFGGFDIYKGIMIAKPVEVSNEIQEKSFSDTIAVADSVAVSDTATVISPPVNDPVQPEQTLPPESNVPVDKSGFFLKEDQLILKF